MIKNDELQRFIVEHAPIRGEFVSLIDSFQTILTQHPYPSSIRQLLGEALVVAVLLTATIKFKGRLSVQFRGKGKLKLLIAQCNDQFQIRALAKWDQDVSYDELMQSLYDGVLMIRIDNASGGQQSQGIVSWKGHSLAEAIEGYFKDSEQLITKLWLAVNENQAAGLLLQMLPSSEPQLSEMQKEVAQLDWENIMTKTTKIQPEDMLQLDYQMLLRKLYPEEEIRMFPASAVSFRCGCSRKKGENAILTLGKEEAEEELTKHQTIVVTCDFCRQQFIFDRVDVAKIFEDSSDSSSDTHLH